MTGPLASLAVTVTFVTLLSSNLNVIFDAKLIVVPVTLYSDNKHSNSLSAHLTLLHPTLTTPPHMVYRLVQ